MGTEPAGSNLKLKNLGRGRFGLSAVGIKTSRLSVYIPELLPR